jgi:ATP-dependent DNA ligase
MSTKLYGNGSYGNRVWEIWNDHNKILIKANGIIYEEIVEEGKAGKTLSQQVDLRMEARIRNKLASGFKATKEELGAVNTNQLGLVMPMLAVHSKNVRHKNFKKMWIQPKLDGHRCLMNSEIMYTRGGKEITTCPEIMDSINIPEGMTLDGELYVHGYSLQQVASWAKRRQPATLKLALHVYDIVTTGNFSERHELLKQVVTENEFIKVVDTRRYNTEEALAEHYSYYRVNGYEGAILRPDHGTYDAGKRSKTLMKVKMRFDGEYECIDINPDRVGNGVLMLKTPEGREFKTVAPGPNYAKAQQLANKSQFIGRFVTCEYAELSLTRVPQHCVAIRWRKEID